jgi:hypothetical protein
MPDSADTALSPEPSFPGRRLTVLAVIALAAGLAACGGSAQKTSTVTTAAPAAATTTAGTTPTTTPPTTAAPAKKGGGSFCAEARDAEASSIGSADTSGDKTSLAKEYAEVKTIGPKLVASAPAAIRPQMQALITFDLRFYAVLSKADFDFTKIAPSDLTTIEADAKTLTADAAAVTAYVKNTCGVDLGVTTTT